MSAPRLQEPLQEPEELVEQNRVLERLVADKTRELEVVVAELRESQAQRLCAQKLEAIGQLAAGIAHEINTPAQYISDNVTFLMRALGGLTESLASYRLLADAVHAGTPTEALLAGAEAVDRRTKLDYLLRHVPRALEQSLDGLARVQTIVGAMKEFSHPSLGRKAPSDLNEMIRTTITVASNEWRYVAEVKTDLDPSLGPLPCLRDEVNQVLLNLIVNAAHAISEATHEGTRGRGTITLTTRGGPTFVEIRVADTGAGVPTAIRDRIFEPLFTTKPVGKGTGQGLAIVRSIVVDKHGGEIRFESTVGSGTTFIVRLPMTVTEEPA